MLNAYRTVPTPTVPPSSQPTARTVTSMPVRTAPSGPPKRPDAAVALRWPQRQALPGQGLQLPGDAHQARVQVDRVDGEAEHLADP